MRKEEKLIFGVVGNRNRGKSFLLSKLSDETLPNSTSIKREGISIKYPRMGEEGKPADYILMDSAGFENALLETDEFKQEHGLNKEKAIVDLKEIASDKTLTEYFLQSFVVQKSNILIVVLGIISYNEQQLLNRIKFENKNKEGNPPLYVIHNLQTFSLKVQVEDYIQETLLKSATFKLKEIKFIKRNKTNKNSNMNNIYYIEEFYNKEDQKLKVNHLILAMHGTEAGDYYNKFVYDFLGEQFNSLPVNETFPVIEAVKEQLIEASKYLMEETILTNESFITNENEEKIQLNDKVNLQFKKCLIDELGFSSFFGKKFEPKYSYYKCIIDKKEYVCIEVEIKGDKKIKRKAESIDKYWNISIYGKKILDKSSDIAPKLSNIKREEGPFNLNIKLESKLFELTSKKHDKTLNEKNSKDGLICFYFPLMREEKVNLKNRMMNEKKK